MNEVNLPTKFKYLFWDCDFEKLNLQVNGKFIIARILEKGDLDSLKWLFKTYTEVEIFEISQNIKLVSPKTQTFWKLYIKTNA